MPEGDRLLRQLARGAAVSGVLRLLGIALTFLFFLVLARALTAEDFGMFSMLYSLATLFGYGANIGQHVVILRFWPTLDERFGPGVATRAMARGFFLTLVGASIAGAGIAGSGYISPIVERLGGETINLVWTGVLVFAAAMAEFTASALRAQGNIALAIAPRDVAWRAGVVLAVLLIPSAVTLADTLGLVSVALAASCVPQFIVLGRQYWTHRHELLPIDEQKKMAHATRALWAGTFITPLADHGTVVLIGLTLGPAAAGAFFAADRLARLLLVALVGIEQMGGPMLARSYHAGRMSEVRALSSAISAGALVIALVGAAAYVVAGQLALSFFDESYSDAWPALLVLVAGQLVNAACGANAVLLSVAGKEGALLVIRAGWGAISLVAVPAAAVYWGLFGAALASAATIGGWNVCAAVVCRLQLGVPTDFLGVISRLAPKRPH